MYSGTMTADKRYRYIELTPEQAKLFANQEQLQYQASGRTDWFTKCHGGDETGKYRVPDSPANRAILGLESEAQAFAIRVGWWRMRNGKIAHVEFISDHDLDETIYGSAHNSDGELVHFSWYPCGNWIGDSGPDEYDLIEHLPDCTGFSWTPHSLPTGATPVAVPCEYTFHHVCIHCGQELDNALDGLPAIQEHDRQCPDNPLVEEREDLIDSIAFLEAKLKNEPAIPYEVVRDHLGLTESIEQLKNGEARPVSELRRELDLSDMRADIEEILHHVGEIRNSNPLVQQLAEAKREVERYKTQFIQEGAHVAALTAERDSLTEQLTTARAEVFQTHKELDAMKSDRDYWKIQADAAREGNDRLSELLEGVRAELKREEIANGHLSHDLTAARAEVERLTARVNQSQGTAKYYVDELCKVYVAIGKPLDVTTLQGVENIVAERDKLQSELAALRETPKVGGLQKSFAEVQRLVRLKAVHRKGFSLDRLTDEFVLGQACEELKELGNEPNDPTELADLLGVLFHYAVRKGWTLERLDATMLAKFEQRFFVPTPAELSEVRT